MTRNEIALQRIKEMYKQKHLTIQEFSELIGKSKSSWLRRESGEVPLTLDEIDFIASKMGTKFETLTDASSNTTVNNFEKTCIQANNGATISINLSPEQLNKVIEVLK